MDFINIPSFETLGTELAKSADAVSEDGTESITAMMENLEVATRCGVPYFAPVEKVIPRRMEKVSVPAPETSWTPETLVTPRPGSPLAKRSGYNAEMRAGVACWMREQIKNAGASPDSLAKLFADSDPEYSQLIREIGTRL